MQPESKMEGNTSDRIAQHDIDGHRRPRVLAASKNHTQSCTRTAHPPRFHTMIFTYIMLRVGESRALDHPMVLDETDR